ncbi:hypothetical protein [Marinobacter sp.]|uniref:hypothetical protein n=1 Tax=Marinobacter sp. TaxID=50741 RepID=UPI003A919198
MSDPVISRVRRSINEARNKGGMRVGMPKVTISAADAERLCLMAEKLKQAEARVAELEGSVKHAIGWIDGDLREIIRDVGNQICSYNDLYESADRIEYMLSEVFRKQADEAEKAGGEHA